MTEYCSKELSTTDESDGSAPWMWSASRVASSVRAGEVSASDVVRSAYARVDEVNPQLNAIVEENRARAMADAAVIDARLSRGEPVGPLAGVPVTIKLNVDVAGEATNNGTPSWRDRVATTDSGVVANLRRAGAIVIGRTNTPPYNFRWFTENTIYGRTQNPWSVDVTSGGSSGGAGVAVAAGMGPIAHGTDIAGSIRYPAHVNGVVGLRSTTGRVPALQSTVPKRHFGLQAMSSQGPLARSVGDIRLALAAMAADGCGDPTWVQAALSYPDDGHVTRVGLVEAVGDIPVDHTVRESLRSAAAALSAAGYQVDVVSPPNLERGLQIWSRIVMTEARFGLMREVAAGSDKIIEKSVRNMAILGRDLDLGDYVEEIAERDRYRQEWTQFLEKYPIVLMPVSTEPAFAWGADLESEDAMLALLAAQSPLMAVAACGLPGLSVPTGVTSGLPVGVQLVGAAFREMRLLNAGAVIEAAHSMPRPSDSSSDSVDSRPPINV